MPWLEFFSLKVISFENILDVFVCNKFKFQAPSKVEDHANFDIVEFFLRLTNGLNRWFSM